MPDLQPVYDELCRRLSVHADAFEVTDNSTNANAAGGRKADDPLIDEGFFDELADLTRGRREFYAEQGLLCR